jgi:hypothetical protein
MIVPDREVAAIGKPSGGGGGTARVKRRSSGNW